VTTRPTTSELASAFRAAEASRSNHQAFEELVLRAGPDAHYRYLNRAKNPDLIEILADSFLWREDDVKPFLFRRLRDERGPRMLAMVVQMLGVMGARELAPHARRLLRHRSAMVRERACIVLGWIGEPSDLALLGELQLSEPDPATRKWAATQQYHLVERVKRGRSRALRQLATALNRERDRDVLEMIAWTAGQLLGRRFGGNVDEAVRKARRALARARP
jgi:hypothetical protein